MFEPESYIADVLMLLHCVSILIKGVEFTGLFSFLNRIDLLRFFLLHLNLFARPGID